MCQHLDPSIQVDFDEEGWAEVYKAVDENGYPPYYAYTVYREGEIESSRSSTSLTEQEIQSGKISLGLHVMLQEEAAHSAAQMFADEMDRPFEVIRVRGHRDHLVCAGRWNENEGAVFTRLTVPEDYYLDTVHPAIPTCPDCDQPEDECYCPVCEYCWDKEQDCTCPVCEHCEKKEEGCECERCPHCDEKEPECDCTTCDHCSEKEGDCECEVCPGCDELVEECACEEEEDEDGVEVDVGN